MRLSRDEEMITMMFWYGGGWAWWQAGLMWVAMIVFWVAVIWAGYALITSFLRRPDRQDRPDSEQPGPGPRRILDERLARGEIDVEEYQRLREALGADPGSRPSATASR